MNYPALIHPDWLAHVQPNHYPSLCTIRTPNTTRDAIGHPVPNPQDLGGHIDIACRIAPVNTREVRTELQIYVNATHHVALNGYYPDIAEDMSAVVDGVSYDIEGVEHDGNDVMTRLWVRIVDHGASN